MTRLETIAPPTARFDRLDVLLPLGAFVLVALAHGVGRALDASGVILLLPFPPIYATWAPHLGAGSVPAVACLGLAVWLRRTRLPWRRLLVTAWAVGLGWIFSLAAVDGDWATKMLSPHEYLHDLGRIGDPWTFLRTFTDFIVGVPGAWTTHVSVHPPLATLVFWLLDRIGLGGPAWAGAFCMVAGSLALPALAVAIRDLGSPLVARRLLPVGAVFPGAVWIGVSGDAVFAGVSCVALALYVHGAVSGRWWASALGGLGAGAMLYLSYGHVLYLLVFGVAAWLSVRRAGASPVLRATLVSLAGVGAVVAFFTLAGFRWWAALPKVTARYDEGIASVRPYSYFVWANLAALVVCASPLVLLVLRWAVQRLREPAAALALAGLAVVLLADLSGLSKAETERIWLTFAATIWCAAGLAPRRWRLPVLLGAAGWALAVNHLLLTEW